MGELLLDARIEEVLSTARFERYRLVTHSDEDAWKLYVFNGEMSGAYFELITWVEVGLRNRLSKSLQAFRETISPFGSWYDIDGKKEWFSPWYTEQSRYKIREALRKTGKMNGEIKSDKVIAELTLGFWTNLLAPRYEQSLWTPALRKSFPKGYSRGEIFVKFKRLNLLRNRVAHHEPIFHENHLLNWFLVLECLDWIEPKYREIVENECRLPHLGNRFINEIRPNLSS